MPIHKVGPFKVEVLHEEHLAEKRIDVLIVVYEGREFLDLVRFDFRGFNSGELRKKIPSLSAFPARAIDAVVEDARALPKPEAGKPRPSTAKEQAGRKPKSRRSSHRKRR